MAKKYKSRIARVVHESAVGAFKAGVMDKATMRKFDVSCLIKVDALKPAEIQALREREKICWMTDCPGRSAGWALPAKMIWSGRSVSWTSRASRSSVT